MAKQPVIIEWSLEEKLLRLEEISSALDKGELAIEVLAGVVPAGHGCVFPAGEGGPGARACRVRGNAPVRARRWAAPWC